MPGAEKAKREATERPGTPNTPTVSAGGSDSINAQWTAPSDNGGSQVKMYAVLHTPPGGMDGTVKVMQGLSQTLTGLQVDTEYSVEVAACNAVGMSEWSTAATVRTSALTPRQDPPPTQTPGDGNKDDNDGNDNGDDSNTGSGSNTGGGGSNTGGGSNSSGGIAVVETCSSGYWAGHTHSNDVNYWGGTDCLKLSLIDDIDSAPRWRMWTKKKMIDHRHPGFNDANYGEPNAPRNSCNSLHVAAHSAHTVLSGCGP